ncbi:MAG TPA: hypothetical protein EYP49_14920 [Anaerolineae bacterium]|nr:hypothetical protein [Anaerolineae bacterium]
MNSSKSKFQIIALVAVALITLMSGAPAQGEGDPCVDPNNLTYNCQFNKSFPGGVPEGWTRFDESGHPTFDQSHDTPFDSTSLRIWSDGVPFTSGIYQQVPNVTPGTAYVAAIGWAPAQMNQKRGEGIERMLGIDPLGGTDSTSPNVVWGPVYSGKSRAPDLRVSAVAQNTTITVFVRVRVPQTHGIDEVFLDAVGLSPDPNQPTPTDTPVPPTDTPVPPTDTPVPPTDTPVPPTDTPVLPTDTPLPTETPTPEPTATPTPPATTAAMANNPPPRPKATAEPRAVPAPESRQATDWVPYMFLGAGFASFGGAALMIGLMVWLWRSGGTGSSQNDSPGS